MIQYPTNLQPTEIGGNGQPGRRPKLIDTAGSNQCGHHVVNPSILPDDRIHYRIARSAIPKDRSLTLIRDSNSRQVSRFQIRPVERLRDDLTSPLQNFLRVVLHPPRLWIELLMLSLRDRYAAAAAIEHHEACTGRPLVDRTKIPLGQAHIAVRSSAASKRPIFSCNFRIKVTYSSSASRSVARFHPNSCARIRGNHGSGLQRHVPVEELQSQAPCKNIFD